MNPQIKIKLPIYSLTVTTNLLINLYINNTCEHIPIYNSTSSSEYMNIRFKHCFISSVLIQLFIGDS
jgi:hypothetical protein